MSDSWYDRAAKSGLLGSKAKVAAGSGHAGWQSDDKSESKVSQMRRKVVDTLSKVGGALQPSAYAKDREE